MNDHVEQAARALLHPSTYHVTRTSASQYLEAWSSSTESWQGFVEWLQHCHTRRNNASSCSMSIIDPDAAMYLSMELLCLQLLQIKIRREIPLQPGSSTSNHIPPHLAGSITALVSTLTQILQMESNTSAVVSSACIAMTALSIRCGQTSELFNACTISITPHEYSGNHRSVNATSAGAFSPVVAWKLLASIPMELSTCALTTSQVTENLQSFAEPLLNCVHQVLTSHYLTNATAPVSPTSPVDVQVLSSALEALHHWTKLAHIPISAWNNPTGMHMRQPPLLLPAMLQLLSTPPADEQQVVVWACRAMTAALRIPTDACTETRSIACNQLLQTSGFVSVPLQVASNPTSFHNTSSSTELLGDHENDEDCWEDACHALAVLFTTLVCEQIDEIVDHEDATTASVQMLLLNLQQHHLIRVRMTVLDVWLTIQDIPTAERHLAWTKPLFSRLLPVLLESISYPTDYPSQIQSHSTSPSSDWAESSADESEWKENRRLVTDVLIATYFLLRYDYVEYCVRWTLNLDANWRVPESAFFALTASAREVCARIKTTTKGGIGGGTTSNAGATSLTHPKGLVATDREGTSQALLHLVHALCSQPALANRHVRILGAAVDFVGSYAAAWEVLSTDPQPIVQLLTFLHPCLAIPGLSSRSALSIRSLLIGCSATLLKANNSMIVRMLENLVASSISTNDEAVLASILEGCTRLVVQSKDETLFRTGVIKLVEPILQSGNATLALVLQSDHTNSSVVESVESICRSLHGLKVILQFCDNVTSLFGPSSLSEVVNVVWTFLHHISKRTELLVRERSLLQAVLSLHEQLLVTIPTDIMTPHLDRSLTQVVQWLEQTQHPGTLKYISRAVEVYGNSDVDSVAKMWAHVSALVLAYVSRGGQGSSSMMDSAELLASFFELHQRFVLYCPAAFLVVDCPSSHLPASVACAVECLTSCGGERDATRASLNWLSQLFGWTSYSERRAESSNLSSEQCHQLSMLYHKLLLPHGEQIVRQCLQTLMDGPQMLGPACADCLYAILSSSVASTPQSQSTTRATTTTLNLDENNPASSMTTTTLGVAWLWASRPPSVDPQLFQQVVSILCSLFTSQTSRDTTHVKTANQVVKPKIRMIFTDFAKIHHGELSVDALIGYSLS